MSEMVKRVAILIAGKMAESYDDDPLGWDDVAHDAIKAMREPTGAMVDAAWASWEDVEGSKGFVGVWQAMIDVAAQDK
jgi:hypothetical protein